MNPQISIVDYQMGNVFSVEKRIRKLGFPVTIAGDRSQIERADKLILPGVGHFGKAMETLHSLNLIDALNEAVLHRKIPILGICLGMQLFANRSEEGNSSGLGWIEGEIVRFNIEDKHKFKVPHTGWNSVDIRKSSKLMGGIEANAEFYFVHSYHFTGGREEDILTETQYEKRFVSAIEKENIFGVQFHPEKSHDSGELLIKNFIEL